MAISFGLISSGLTLVTTILNRIWAQEEGVEKNGSEKHAYVKGFVASYLEKHGVRLNDPDGFISDLIDILNKHEIFTKERR